jgi:signal transduction histidine kinase
MTGLRRALVGIAFAGAASGAAVSLVVANSDHESERGALVAITLAVAASFIGTGLYAWDRRPENGTGALMVAVGFAWYLIPLSAANAPAVFAFAVVFGNLFYAVLIHLLLAFPEGRLEGRRNRLLAGASYVVAVAMTLPPVLFFETPQEGCEGCPRNPILITDSRDAADLLFGIQSLLAVPLLIAVAVVVIRRRRAAQGAERDALAPMIWAGAAVFAVVAFQLAANIAGGQGVAQILFFVSLLAVAGVPYGFLAGLLRSRISRAAAVSELVERLGSAPGGERELRDALAETLGDPTLALTYWLPDGERWVDAEGRSARDPSELAGVATTMVRHEGKPVAALVHDPRLKEHPELLDTVGAAAGIALENQRLDAALRARVEELQASRARLVEASDTARRQLERDLHDGAQQRLVALALDLRLARGKLESDPEAATQLLDASIDELAAATDELRELARGIHPALLTDRGLGPALDALASRAPLPVELESALDDRLPGPVESAAYFVVAEALTNVARYARATHAAVSIARTNGRLVVEVRDDGIGGADPAAGSGLRGLEDRLAALDGRLEVSSPNGSGTLIRAEVPCE